MTVADVEPPLAAAKAKSVAMPERETDCGLPGALSAIASDAVSDPSANGVKLTGTEQLAPALSVPPASGHVPPFAMEKSPLFVPEMVTPVIARFAFPELLSITHCATLVVPTICPGKLVEFSDREARGPTPEPVRVAPTGMTLKLFVTCSAPDRGPG